MKDRNLDPPSPDDNSPTEPLDGEGTLTSPDSSGRPASSTPMPESIAGYRIIRMLGAGGMGVVWEAEQQNPPRRVAVKVMLRAQVFNPLEALMFEREVEMLGRLKHPNIAAIYDSGRTEGGHGYFAMELVRGATLHQWLATRPSPLTRDEMILRLRIFQAVCDAVNYAHQRGVIHRDLKPSNLVVTGANVSAPGLSGAALPVVMVLDFGLARLAGTEAEEGGLLTQVGVIRGTPQYMSPEQARGEVGSIDLRADVYSLGVILYELLTKQRPYDLAGVPMSEAVPVICNTPPKSLRESWDGPGRVDPDLATIVGKALEKEPERRYASALALSEDLERFLTAQPILARAPSHAYQAKKFLQRHRIGATVAIVGLLTLAAFAATMTVQARRIARERDRANREAEAFRRVAKFMTGMFRVSDPSEARGNSVTAREILDKATSEIDTGLADDPELRARLSSTMGGVYRGLGLYAKAQPLLEQARETFRQTLGPENPETLKSTMDLISLLAQQGNYTEAERVGREVLEIQRRVLAPDDPDLTRTMSNVAVVAWYQGHLAIAESLLLEALERSRRLRGNEHTDTLAAMNNLGLVYMDERKYSEAATIFRDDLEIRRRTVGPDHPESIKALLNLAIISQRQGHLEEAERLFRECLDLNRRVLGPEHPDTLSSMGHLATVQYESGKFREAESLQRETLRLCRRVLGPDHPATLHSMNTLANTLDSEGRHDEAEPLYREALEGRRRALGPEHVDTLMTMTDLAECRRGQGRYAESEKLLKEVLAIQERTPAEDQPDIGLTLYGLGCVSARRGEKEQALAYLRRALEAGLPPEIGRKMPVDPELERLRGDARFAALAAEAREGAGKDSR